MSLQETYNKFKATLEEIQTKIAQLEDECEQHHKVITMLKDVDGERNSMQMIGSVLVEKKVKDVIPSLNETLKGLETALESLYTQKKQWESKMETWKVENKVKVVGS